MNLEKELKAEWNSIRTLALKRWKEISTKDLDKVRGSAVDMVSLLQKKLNLSKADANRKVEELLSKYSKRDVQRKIGSTTEKYVDKASDALDVVKKKIKKGYA